MFFCCLSFETELHYVAQADFESLILLPQTFEFLNGGPQVPACNKTLDKRVNLKQGLHQEIQTNSGKPG